MPFHNVKTISFIAAKYEDVDLTRKKKEEKGKTRKHLWLQLKQRISNKNEINFQLFF